MSWSSDDMSFKNKVIIITGSSSGIGAATAKIFAKEHAKVTIVGRNEKKLKEVETECAKLSGNPPLTIIADVSKDDEARGIVNKTIEHYGKLDVLVNNAGYTTIKSVLDPNYVAEFDNMMATNLRSVVVITHTALPHLIESKGNIVNVSSVAGARPSASTSHYCTSKAALNHFSRCIALEVASRGVRVNVVCPGPVKTNMISNIGISEKQWEASGTNMPLGFISESEEIGDLIAYLASDKARSVTGSSYVIDVGMSLKGF